ncbi:hypothetical protein ACEQ8H_007277 [Pleosporales sp. CAS-2024a]
MAPSRVDEQRTKKRRGRPPGSRKSDAPKAPTKSPVTKTKSKPKPQPKPKPRALAEEEDELSGAAPSQAQRSEQRMRKAQPARDEVAEGQSQSGNKYVQLEAKTKRIPQEQIDTWPQISTQVLDQIVEVIRAAKNDIANQQPDQRRSLAAHNTLNPLVRKLERQLAASLVPPQAKDIHFNIDKLTERNAQVARDVTTARHAKQLLAEQVRVAEQLLDRDERILEALKKDTKKWRTEWKHQEKHERVHPLLRESEEASAHSDRPDDIGLRRSAPIDASLLDMPDAELAPVLEQLQRSLENMQGNHIHVQGIDGALREAQTALDDVLFRHAGAQQYAAL